MLKLISLNLERDLHYATALPFLKNENADVVCLQEVIQADVPIFEEALGMKAYFVPMAIWQKSTDPTAPVHVLGVAILTRHTIVSSSFSCIYRALGEDGVPVFKKAADSYVDRHHINVVLASLELVLPGEAEPYHILTTHFTWTPEGLSTPYQKEDIGVLLEKLSSSGEFVLCGDFNAPRGKESFTMIAEKYTDNIPDTYNTSIDQVLHRVSGLIYMVDGLFSTPSYILRDVRLQDGVSDHKAIVASVYRE